MESISPEMLVDQGICPTCYDRTHGLCLYGDPTERILYENDSFTCLLITNPRCAGHTIITTKMHYKVPFGEILYEIKNVPNHEMVYLQTDYDYCRSNYFVLETEYDRYRKLLEDVEFGTYYSEYYNECFYRWERQITPDLCTWLQNPDTVAVSEKPESLAVLNIRMYDADHIFYRDAGRIYQTEDGYYWFPEAFASYTYEPDSAGLGQYFPVQSGKYFPISGFDNELYELFSN